MRLFRRTWCVHFSTRRAIQINTILIILTWFCHSCGAEAPVVPTAITTATDRMSDSLGDKSRIKEIKLNPTKLPHTVPLPTTPATIVPTPMRFAFPTMAVAPITIWRPPLYPTPWEPTPNDHFYFSRPIGANEINWPTAHYRYGGTFIESFIHTGVDIPAPKGTPVMAAGSGIVIWEGYGLYFQSEKFSDPYGLAIAIKHDFGYKGSALYTIYGHLDAIHVDRGEKVNGGDIIGLVGETGKTTGPHLHFEVRIGKNDFFVTRNPELWLTPPQGWGIIAARVMETNGELLMKQTIHIRKLSSDQHWSVITYAGGGVNSDPYYKENVVIGDLPAGDYLITTEYNENSYSIYAEILPGMVTYLRFVGNQGFYLRPPSTPTSSFIPPDQSQQPPLDK